MKIKNVCIIIFIIFGLSTLGCINSSDDEVEKVSTEQVTQIPASFEDKIRIEIKNKNHTGVTIVSNWIDKTNITYHENSKTLWVEIVPDPYWNAKHLNTILFDATFNIMEVAVKHPDKITNVTIVGKAKMMDAQGRESISEVYRVNTTMDSAKNVNWENLQMYERYSNPMGALRANFDNVQIYPPLNNAGVY